MPAPKIDIQVQNGLVQVRAPMNSWAESPTLIHFSKRLRRLRGNHGEI